MSEVDDAIVDPRPEPPKDPKEKSFLSHAKLIGALTLLSRVTGMLRESVSAKYFGAGTVASAFVVAFSIPNLFRKLFGEGALSAAFIPLYTWELKHNKSEHASEFAAASVNLLCLALAVITVIGEIVIAAMIFLSPDMRPDRLLTLKFTAIMLPYVLLICGTAFLSAILQVHKKFGAPAFAPVLLNVMHIIVIVLGAKFLHLQTGKSVDATFDAGTVARQTQLAYWLSVFVLIAGVMQVMILWRPLRKVGFRFRWVTHFWTPAVKRMLVLSIPVALGASVLQTSVLMDKGISLLLAKGQTAGGEIIDTFTLLGHTIRYPMDVGAAARLNWAQFLYQFPLGVFAIALATAIFPGLSADALDKDRDKFRSVLRLGILATLFEGIAASIGLILVRYPAAKLLFLHGDIRPADIEWIARSVMIYATAIWAFSLLQILNRAFYALHDTKTPLVMSIINIVLNVVVEIPLIWIPWLGESGMAAGTAVSFSIQTIVMLIMLDRRVGDLRLADIAKQSGKMLFAAAVMAGACYAVAHSPIYPQAETKFAWSIQLAVLMSVGAAVYFAVCTMLGIDVIQHLRPKKKTKPQMNTDERR